MMLQIIPNDCLMEISKHMNNYDNYRLYMGIYDNRKISYLICIVNRIKFIRKVNKKLRDFKKIVCMFVKRCFKLPFHSRGPCLFYAPVVPNGICRHCQKYNNQHLLKEKCLNILLKLWEDTIYL